MKDWQWWSIAAGILGIPALAAWLQTGSAYEAIVTAGQIGALAIVIRVVWVEARDRRRQRAHGHRRLR